MVQPLWKTGWRILKKVKVELSYDPLFPLLGLYPKETKTLILKKKICTSMFITLFTKAKT